MIRYLIFFMLLILLVFATEFGSYIWHNVAHDDIIPGVHETHRMHHKSELTHEAHEDFIWVIVLLILLGIFLLTLYYYDLLYFDRIYFIISYLVIVLIFIWNWYIHSAYHIPNHWLNSYQWFRRDKKIHLQHHVNPRANYGIASHFSDVIFGTYEYPYDRSI